MATAAMYALVVALGVIIVVTIIDCLLTIVTIWTRPVLRKLVNLPLASLRSADILFTFVGPALWIQFYLHPQWQPPGALCWFQAYATPVLWGVSVCHMACIALQRYFKICTNSTRLKSKSALITMLCLTWLVPIASFLPLHIIEETTVAPKLGRCSLGSSTNALAKVPAVVIVFIIPYIVALISYILIYNNVRKSHQRLASHAQRDSNRLAVQSNIAGSSSGNTSSVALVKYSKKSDGGVRLGGKNLDGGVWKGDTNSSTDEEQEGNASNEPDKSKVADPPGLNKQQQQHGGQGNKSKHNSAEWEITKMMLMLFVVYTVCCMPMTIMVMFSSKVPPEGFIVASLLVSMNGALNPVVYGLMNTNIRQGYKHIWNSILSVIT